MLSPSTTVMSCGKIGQHLSPSLIEFSEDKVDLFQSVKLNTFRHPSAFLATINQA